MNKKNLNYFILITLLFCIPGFIHASYVSSSPKVTTSNCTTGLSCGLLGYWTLDGKDMLNGVVLDKSGNGNNGNLMNISTSTFFTAGKIGQGFNFDGVDDYVDAGSGVPLDSNNWTIHALIKSKDNSHNQRFLSYYGAGPTMWNYNGVPALVHSGVIDMSCSAVIFLGAWSDITFTRSGSTLTCYKDGVQAGQNTSFSSTFTKDTSIRIGNSTAFGENAAAVVDDVRIYNRALTATEVSQLYNLANSTHLSSSPQVSTTTCTTGLSCGLIAYWTMDGKDTDWNGSQMFDKSGNGQTCTLTSMSATTNTAPGKIGQAIAFTSSGTDKLSCPQAFLENQPALSASLWIKPTKSTIAGTENVLVNSNNSSQQTIIFRRETSSTVSCTIRTTANAITTTGSVINDDKWHHLVCVYNGTDIRIYADSAQSGTPTAQSGSTMDTFGSLVISRNTIDDVRIYNRALSQTEVTQLYNQSVGSHQGASPQVTNTNCTTGPSCGLVGYWTFDGKDMANGVALDKSGTGSNGTLTSIATSTFYAVGKIGQAANFDGVDDYIKLPNNFATNFSGGKFTITLWIRENSQANKNSIIKNWGGSTGAFHLDTTSNFLTLYITQSNGSQIGPTTDTTTIPLNSWQYVTAVADGSFIKLYRNGVQVGTPVAYNGTLKTSFLYTYIGVKPDDSGNTEGVGYFSGKMDGLRVYNRALSATEISRLYNQEK